MYLMLPERIFEEIATATSTADDRRTHDRIKLMRPMHVSPIGSDLILETATVVDISRGGLYFVVKTQIYKLGMELGLKIPSIGFECACKIVRIEKLPTGGLGVAGIILDW
jgi:hypothetical protein